MTKQDIEYFFPNLLKRGYKITSPATVEYNCIAWAVNDIKTWWWPDSLNIYYWPAKISRRETLDSFVNLYKSLDYSICSNNKYEENFEKVAIFIDSKNKPTHIARQLDTGSWTSKLGELEDIEHNFLKDLEGKEYGFVKVILKRQIK